MGHDYGTEDVLVWFEKSSEPLRFTNATVYTKGDYTNVKHEWKAGFFRIEMFPTDHIFRIRLSDEEA